jgi:hypothetical protein
MFCSINNGLFQSGMLFERLLGKAKGADVVKLRELHDQARATAVRRLPAGDTCDTESV